MKLSSRRSWRRIRLGRWIRVGRPGKSLIRRSRLSSSIRSCRICNFTRWNQSMAKRTRWRMTSSRQTIRKINGWTRLMWTMNHRGKRIWPISGNPSLTFKTCLQNWTNPFSNTKNWSSIPSDAESTHPKESNKNSKKKKWRWQSCSSQVWNRSWRKYRRYHPSNLRLRCQSKNTRYWIRLNRCLGVKVSK